MWMRAWEWLVGTWMHGFKCSIYCILSGGMNESYILALSFSGRPYISRYRCCGMCVNDNGEVRSLLSVEDACEVRDCG